MLTLLESRLVLDELGAADGSRAFAPAAEKGRTATSFLIADRTQGAVVAANNPVNEVDPFGLQTNLNLFPPSQPIYTNFNSTPLNTNAINVGIHGGPTGFYTNSNYTAVSPSQLANIITNQPGYNPTAPINLYSCQVGVGGTNSQAGQLSNILPNPVNAGTNYMWVGSGTNYFAPGTWTNTPTGNTLIQTGPAQTNGWIPFP